MGRDIILDGAEISVIRAIGLSGSELSGETLLDRIPELPEAELIDTLKGLIDMGYVSCDVAALHDRDDLEKAHVQCNSGYIKDLREALDPTKGEKPKSKRVRRE